VVRALAAAGPAMSRAIVHRLWRALGPAPLLLALAAAPAAAETAGERLDWQVEESAHPSLPVRAARNVRDGVLTFADAFLDANTALFGEFALVAGKLTMGVSDVIGLVDDNPLTEHVTRGVLSGALARTAYLWHLAGSESLLGGHGMAEERWAGEAMAGLNPLLGEDDARAPGGPLPLDPLEFVEEGLLHDRVYRTHSALLGLGAVAVADVALRPAAGVLRIVQWRSAGDALERTGNDLVRRSTEVEW
jgi:hypothetical protein